MASAATSDVFSTFTYNGTPYYALTSILNIKDLEYQIEEIDNRLKALAAHCVANRYVMTDTHIRVVLGRLSDSTFKRLLRGVIPYKKKYVHYDLCDNISLKEKRLYRERQEVLQGWRDCAEMTWADGVSVEKFPTGKIFLGKVYFNKREAGQTDTPSVSTESLVAKKASRKK